MRSSLLYPVTSRLLQLRKQPQKRDTSVRNCPSEPCGQNRCEFVCLHSEQNLQLFLRLIQNRAAVRTATLSDGYELWCHETPTSVCSCWGDTTGSWILNKGSIGAVLRAAAHFLTRSQSLRLVIDLLSLQPVSSCGDRTIQTRHKTRTPHISQPEGADSAEGNNTSVCCTRDVLLRREADVTLMSRSRGSDPDVCQVSGN